MKKSSLSSVERQIIESMLLTEYGPESDFLRQLAAARVDKRRLTGVGIFVDLAVPQGERRVDKLNAETSAAYCTRLPAPSDLVGFTLFIRHGVLSFLEGYTYGDAAWPDEPLKNWLIFDPIPAEAPHQKAN